MASQHPDDKDLDEMEHRLDELEEGIQKARHDAQEDRLIPGKHEPTFIDPDNDQRIEDEDEHPGTTTAI
jgi:hypothetical protein